MGNGRYILNVFIEVTINLALLYFHFDFYVF